jgi:hypothetical protein
VQVLDNVYANAGIIPNLSFLEAEQIPLSNLDRIIADPQETKYPPVEIVGDEIDHGWCYYFEKADLARQVGNWDTVLALKSQADTLGLSPRIPSEWLPFLKLTCVQKIGQLPRSGASQPGGGGKIQIGHHFHL